MHKNRPQLIHLTHKLITNILEKRNSKYDWQRFARPEQIPPSEWKIWLILAGRGFGKTRTGAETVRHLIQHENYKRICFLGETMEEVRRIMIDGKSGVLNIYPAYQKPTYYPSLNKIIWPNGAIGHGFSAERVESLRGPEFDLVWIDELAKFPNPDECFKQVQMTMRVGNNPKLIITTTPRPITLIKKLTQNPDVHVTRGSTMSNAENLPPVFIESILQEYGDTNFGLQEIYGEIIQDDCKQLWTEDTIQYTEERAVFEDIIIGVDPSVTFGARSDETGIIVVGRNGNKFYVLEDSSLKANVLDWAATVVALSYKYQSDIVIENNQGGNLAKELILQIDPNLYVHEVRASKSKLVRAQPVAMLYRTGTVFHLHRFEELERQMIDFMSLSHSPDRVDALVWCITYLNKNRARFQVI